MSNSAERRRGFPLPLSLPLSPPRYRRARRSAVRLLPIVALLSAMPAAWAADPAPVADRGLSATLGMDVTSDSNVFRVPDGADPSQYGFPNVKRADILFSPYATLDAKLAFARERLHLAATERLARYQSNTNFDGRYADLVADTHSELADVWVLDLSGDQNQAASNYADFRTSTQNTQTTRHGRVALTLQPHSFWMSRVIYDYLRGRDTAPAAKQNDFNVSSVRAEAGVKTSLGKEFTLGVMSSDGTYPTPQNVNGTLISNDYREREADVRAMVPLGGSTSATARIGYSKRRYREVPQRDYSSLAGVIDFAWEATGHLSFRAGVARPAEGLQDQFLVYAVTTRVHLDALYQVSQHLGLSATVAQVKTKYEGDPTLSTQRQDRTPEWTLAADWHPTERLALNLGYDHISRTSNLPGNQFVANVWTLRTSYRFE